MAGFRGTPSAGDREVDLALGTGVTWVFGTCPVSRALGLAITLMAGVDLSPGAAPPVVPACLVGAAVACWGRLPAQTQSGVSLLGELCDSPGQWMGSLLQIC